MKSMYEIPMIKFYHQPKMNIRALYSTIENKIYTVKTHN
jgi:hypothetical protein